MTPQSDALLSTEWQVDGEAEAKLRAHGKVIWQRLLYTRRKVP